jgi:hypothetical protein
VVNDGYELYCLPDSQFYDSAMIATVQDKPFAIAGRDRGLRWPQATPDRSPSAIVSGPREDPTATALTDPTVLVTGVADGPASACDGRAVS